MAKKDHPKFDKSGHYRLNDKHLMAFLHHDGFTERLLGVNIFITKSFEVEVYLRCFKKGKSYGGFESELIIKKVPTQVLEFLDLVSQVENIDFGFEKRDNHWFEDAMIQNYLFDHNGTTKGFHVTGGMTVSENNFATEFGRKFFALYKFLNDWKEDLYQDFCKNAA